MLKSFKVISETVAYEEYESDENGFAKNTKETTSVEPPISLIKYLERIKVDFYKGITD